MTINSARPKNNLFDLVGGSAMSMQPAVVAVCPMGKISTPDQFCLRELGLATYPAGFGACFRSEEQAGGMDHQASAVEESEVLDVFAPFRDD